jgi:putative flippase GtrA
MVSSKLGFEKITNMSKNKIVEALISLVTAAPTFIIRNRCFVFSFVMTVVFYLPSFKNSSVDAGFLYTGDVIGYYLPAFAKTHALLSSFNFTALDFSSFNGSSDYFLAANFFAVHPMVVLYSLLVSAKTTSMQELGHYFVFMLAVHSFLACYFSLKLFTRFFSFEFGLSGLIATVFAFSIYMMRALGEPEYLFSTCILPWAAYSALAYVERPSLRQLLFACLPIIGGILGGYLPLGIATLALSVILVATKLLLLNESNEPLNKRAHTFLSSLLPYALAMLIVGPYLYSVQKFLDESSSNNRPSLFFSAHQLAEQPQALLRLLSHHYFVPGPFYEFSILWGFIALSIAALFLLSQKSIEVLTSRDWVIFKVAAVLYFATVLAIFGEISAVSNLVYYLVPQVGKMHIYQRFLLPINLFFGVMIALMLKSLVEVRPFIATRIALTILALTTLTVAYLVGRNPAFSHEIGLNNYIIFELILGFLFLFALIIPGKTFIYSVTIVLFCLPALDLMHDYSQGGNTLQEQRKRLVVALDDAEKTKLVSYLKKHFGDKRIIKYVDITPRWTKEGIEPFPKSFPYFILNELQLSSYTGFNFYLSSRDDYMLRMPISGKQTSLAPDWEMATNTGADFVVALGSDIKGGALNSVLGKTRTEDLFKLPNDVVIAPIRPQADKMVSPGAAIFDNGYLKVYPKIIEDDRKLLNLARGKPARQSSNFGSGFANLGVDGNKDGDLNHGSVMHTERDANAWFEVDLGVNEPIDSLRIWNRTDCCGFRLRDYWVFISEHPFLSSDTTSILQERPETWSHHVIFSSNLQTMIKTDGARGRYVRIQLGGFQPIDQSFLSLAELEVFRIGNSQDMVPSRQANATSDLKVTGFITNNANYIRLSLESSSPASVEYLFSDNPRLRFYLNGKRATLVKREGLRAINVPAGQNTIEIRYRHWPLTIFWVFYALYATALLWALIPINFCREFFKQSAYITNFAYQSKSSWKNEIKLNFRYGLAGVLNSLFGLGAIWALTTIGIIPVAANFIGFAVGIAFAFLISRKFVFKSNDHLNSEALRYLRAFGVSYLINIAMLQMCVSVFLINALLSQGIAVTSYVICMYLASRFYIFRNNKK